MFDYKQRPFSPKLTDAEYDRAVGRIPDVTPAQPKRPANPRKPYHPQGECSAPTCGSCKYGR